MGAANVARVYFTWAHLDDRPFRLLAYMAMRARDHDAVPWYGAGHEELAEIALGLVLKPGREREAAMRAVRRAVSALHRAGAIETTRKAAPGKQATYRLILERPTQDGERPVNNHPTQDGERPVNNSNVGRSATQRRTVSDLTQDAERPTEEEEEEEELNTEEDLLSTRTVEGSPLGAGEPPARDLRLNGYAAVASLRPSKLERAAWQASQSRAARGAQP